MKISKVITHYFIMDCFLKKIAQHSEGYQNPWDKNQ